MIDAVLKQVDDPWAMIYSVDLQCQNLSGCTKMFSSVFPHVLKCGVFEIEF